MAKVDEFSPWKSALGNESKYLIIYKPKGCNRLSRAGCSKWCKLFKHYKTILHILEPIIVSGFFVPKLCQPRALKPLAIKVFSSKNGPFLALFSIFVCSLRLRVKKFLVLWCRSVPHWMTLCISLGGKKWIFLTKIADDWILTLFL